MLSMFSDSTLNQVKLTLAESFSAMVRTTSSTHGPDCFITTDAAQIGVLFELLHLDGASSYYDILRQKLHWGMDKSIQ